MQHWLVAYLITCAVEIPIIMAMVRGLHWRSTATHPRLDLAAMAWALQLTHPILWLVNPVFPAGTAVAEALSSWSRRAHLLVAARGRAYLGARTPIGGAC
jgi:hypothetical protein